MVHKRTWTISTYLKSMSQEQELRFVGEELAKPAQSNDDDADGEREDGRWSGSGRPGCVSRAVFYDNEPIIQGISLL